MWEGRPRLQGVADLLLRVLANGLRHLCPQRTTPNPDALSGRLPSAEQWCGNTAPADADGCAAFAPPFAAAAARARLAARPDRARRGLLRRCFTQNIDSLETAAGLPPEAVVAAHGNMDSAHVLHRPACTVPIDEVKAALMEPGEAGWRRLAAAHGGLVADPRKVEADAVACAGRAEPEGIRRDGTHLRDLQQRRTRKLGIALNMVLIQAVSSS